MSLVKCSVIEHPPSPRFNVDFNTENVTQGGFLPLVTTLHKGGGGGGGELLMKR